MAHFWVLTFCWQVFCSDREDWLAGRQLSRLAAGAGALQKPREQQHNVFLCSQERKERRGAPTILLFSKEKICSNNYPVSQGLDKHCFVACCPTQFHCFEIVCGFFFSVNEKQGVEYTETDTPERTYKKEILKCA